MSYVKLNVKQWPAYMAALGTRMKSAINRGIVSGANACVPILQRRTDEAPPASDHGATGAFNTGNYRRRWRCRAIDGGATVYNDAPQAGVIDGGRRAGGRMPNLRAIEQWARRRLGLSAKDAKRAAYPIAKAIARRGLKPRRVMSGALGEMTEVVTREVMRELDRELGQ